MMEAQGRNYLEMLYLCVVFFIERDVPAIELIILIIIKKIPPAHMDIVNTHSL